MCGSRKYPYPTQGWSMEIPRGRALSLANIFKRKDEAKLEISEEWEGLNQITILGGGMVIVWNHTINSPGEFCFGIKSQTCLS